MLWDTALASQPGQGLIFKRYLLLNRVAQVLYLDQLLLIKYFDRNPLASLHVFGLSHSKTSQCLDFM